MSAVNKAGSRVGTRWRLSGSSCLPAFLLWWSEYTLPFQRTVSCWRLSKTDLRPRRYGDDVPLRRADLRRRCDHPLVADARGAMLPSRVCPPSASGASRSAGSPSATRTSLTRRLKLGGSCIRRLSARALHSRLWAGHFATGPVLHRSRGVGSGCQTGRWDPEMPSSGVRLDPMPLYAWYVLAVAG